MMLLKVTTLTLILFCLSAHTWCEFAIAEQVIIISLFPILLLPISVYHDQAFLSLCLVLGFLLEAKIMHHQEVTNKPLSPLCLLCV